MTDDKPGPTGQFPRGKALEDDSGELALTFKVGVGLNGIAVIIMDFGKNLSWIGLEADLIDELCETLQNAKKSALALSAKQDKN